MSIHTSPDAPLLLISPSIAEYDWSASAAIAGADPGDVLVLNGGAYLGPVTIDRTLTLQGDGSATALPGRPGTTTDDPL